MPTAIGDDTVPHAACVTAIQARLRDLADQHYAAADRLYTRRTTRGNARVQRRMAVAYGWTAGHLRQLLQERR